MDKLKIAKRLQKRGLSEQIAKEFAEILQEYVSSELSPKQDLKTLEHALKADLEKTKARLQKELQEFKAKSSK
ncbi:MAG: hypothetical protein AAF600_12445 [Bacteroidota bacterium]